MEIEHLRLVFIKGNDVEPSMAAKYEEVYRHWETTWSATLGELEREAPFFSDQFTRQDEIMALFYRDQCISACCHRWVDFSLSSFRKDSYFQVWPAEALEKLQKNGNQVLIDSQISVDPQFRKLQSGLRIIELMTCLSLRHLAPLGLSSITAAARNLRSMDQVFEQFSPTKLVQQVFVHGEATSLYAFFPNEIRFEKSKVDLLRLADQLLSGAQRSNRIHPFFQLPQGGSLVKIAA